MKEQKLNKYYSYILDNSYNINITSQNDNTAYLYLLKDGIRVEGIKITFIPNRQSSSFLEEKSKTVREHTHLSNALAMLVKEVLKLKLTKRSDYEH